MLVYVMYGFISNPKPLKFNEKGIKAIVIAINVVILIVIS